MDVGIFTRSVGTRHVELACGAPHCVQSCPSLLMERACADGRRRATNGASIAAYAQRRPNAPGSRSALIALLARDLSRYAPRRSLHPPPRIPSRTQLLVARAQPATQGPWTSGLDSFNVEVIKGIEQLRIIVSNDIPLHPLVTGRISVPGEPER
jgi:hypothetical protein